MMTTHKSYAECKIANPDSEIVTTGKNWIYDKEIIGTFQPRVTEGCSHAINDYSWVVCNPADYCSSLKDYFDAGFKLVTGDKIIGVDKVVWDIVADSEFNHPDEEDEERYIISASALNGGCKIPAKAEQWTVYNNTLPLCELTDEQYGKMRRMHDNGATVQSLNEDGYGFQDCALPTWISNGVYRIKSKSERELFIENTTKVMRDAGTKCPDNHEHFGIMFDAGARYTDKTQFFGERI